MGFSAVKNHHPSTPVALSIARIKEEGGRARNKVSRSLDLPSLLQHVLLLFHQKIRCFSDS